MLRSNEDVAFFFKLCVIPLTKTTLGNLFSFLLVSPEEYVLDLIPLVYEIDQLFSCPNFQSDSYAWLLFYLQKDFLTLVSSGLGTELRDCYEFYKLCMRPCYTSLQFSEIS